MSLGCTRILPEFYFLQVSGHRPGRVSTANADRKTPMAGINPGHSTLTPLSG
jgi:hypothetical protein